MTEGLVFIAIVVFWLILPAKYDPAIQLKLWLERRDKQ